VRWTREGRFGIEFLSLVPEEWARLQHTVTQMNCTPTRRSQLTTRPKRRNSNRHVCSVADSSRCVFPVPDGTRVCSRPIPCPRSSYIGHLRR